MERKTEAEVLERMEAALRRMPRIRREIFLAVRHTAVSYAEIAERTGLSVRQVERHVAKALLQLDDAVHGRKQPSWWRRLLSRWR